MKRKTGAGTKVAPPTTKAALTEENESLRQEIEELSDAAQRATQGERTALEQVTSQSERLRVMQQGWDSLGTISRLSRDLLLSLEAQDLYSKPRKRVEALRKALKQAGVEV